MTFSSNLSPDIEAAIRSSLGSSLASVQSVSGGTICQAFRVESSVGDVFFLKVLRNAASDLFQREALGLKALADTQTFRVPEVVTYHDGEGWGFILLEWIDPASENKDRDWKDAARKLAALHEHSAEHFGFSTDNYIGPTVQRNSPTASFGEFFVEKRLTFQLELLATQDKSFDRLAINFRTAFDGLTAYLDQCCSSASLIHGDLWSGNLYWSDSGPVLIDPAVHYSASEAEIAFTEMFGGFPAEFYEEYFSVRPSADGYSERAEIFNLYHLCNHANIFGGHYSSSVASGFEKLIRQFA